MRSLVAALAALALLTSGCGTGSGGGAEELAIYVSLPLSGERAALGAEIRAGAEEALADAGGRAGGVRLRVVYLDDASGGAWSPVATAENARRAVEDSGTIAYLGDVDDGATRTSLPITNEAGVLQVSPGSSADDLTRRVSERLDPDLYRPSDDQTFVRLGPSDTDLDPGAACVPGAAVGYEAMDLILDSIVAAGGTDADRGGVVDEATSASRTGSRLGDYSVSSTGDTSLRASVCEDGAVQQSG